MVHPVYPCPAVFIPCVKNQLRAKHWKNHLEILPAAVFLLHHRFTGILHTADPGGGVYGLKYFNFTNKPGITRAFY